MSDMIKAPNTVMVINDQYYESLIERFLAELQLSDSSKRTYATGLKAFSLWLKNHPTSRIDHAVLIEYRKHLLNRRLSPQTINSYLTAVKALFSWTEASAIYPNVAGKIKGQRRPSGFLKDALSVEQVRRLLSSIDQFTALGKRNYALINLLIRTGLRTIEVVRANVEDIRYRDGTAVLFVQGKGRTEKDEIVVLTDATLLPINNYLATRTVLKDNAPLFASVSNQNCGEVVTTRTIRAIVREALNAIGIRSSKVTAHSLRHTAITLALKSGASLAEAKMLARHASIDTTLNYAHNLDRIANAPEHKIDSLLSGQLPQFGNSGSKQEEEK